MAYSKEKVQDSNNLDGRCFLNSSFYKKYEHAILDFDNYRRASLPLSAAENVISEFSKKPLLYGLQERYILGGYLDYDEDNNMIGSKKLLPFYEIISEQCKKLFGACYTDCRSLSGMNALQNILLSLVRKKRNVLILSPDSGGHAALPNILERLDIDFIEAPYDYNASDYDYENINDILEKKNIDFIMLAPTDIIFLPDFDRLHIPQEVILIFDASQVLAFYINNISKNPLNMKNKVILMGGTHKTIPGVAKALIMTNDETLASTIDATINPLFLRNTHMQNVASLILTLIEMEYFSKIYCHNMSLNSNYLGEKLEKIGFHVINREGVYSETHQLFIHMEKGERDLFYHRSNELGISLNKKDKRLFRGSGIRLGVQEVTRYGWGYEEMDIIAEILLLVHKNNLKRIPMLLKLLGNKKTIQYTFEEDC